MVTNTEFKGTSGWLGTYSGITENVKNSFGAKISAEYGHFLEEVGFSSVVDELSNGTYVADADYKAYLKVDFPKSNESKDYAVLINSGFYDNRTLIKEVDYGETWYFEPFVYDGSGNRIINIQDYFNFFLREVRYDITKGNYALGPIWATAALTGTGNGEMRFNMASQTTEGYADIKISAEEFKKKEIKLVM
jgi:hypothetical protein